MDPVELHPLSQKVCEFEQNSLPDLLYISMVWSWLEFFQGEACSVVPETQPQFPSNQPKPQSQAHNQPATGSIRLGYVGLQPVSAHPAPDPPGWALGGPRSIQRALRRWGKWPPVLVEPQHPPVPNVWPQPSLSPVPVLVGPQQTWSPLLGRNPLSVAVPVGPKQVPVSAAVKAVFISSPGASSLLFIAEPPQTHRGHPVFGWQKKIQIQIQIQIQIILLSQFFKCAYIQKAWDACFPRLLNRNRFHNTIGSQ